jgi:hypothetical protein
LRNAEKASSGSSTWTVTTPEAYHWPTPSSPKPVVFVATWLPRRPTFLRCSAVHHGSWRNDRPGPNCRPL